MNQSPVTIVMGDLSIEDMEQIVRKFVDQSVERTIVFCDGSIKALDEARGYLKPHVTQLLVLGQLTALSLLSLLRDARDRGIHIEEKSLT